MEVGTVNISLSPYQAMQLLRWKQFIEAAISDPMQEGTKADKKGALEAIKAVDEQVREKITSPQIDDAVAERELKSIIYA
jgi:hypothetical protein